MPLGLDVQFGLDDFQKPMLKPKNDAIAQSLLNILLMRKGQLPSLPHIGVDINSYMYRFEDELDEDALLLEIQKNSSELAGYINADGIRLAVVPVNGQNVLMIVIPIIGETNVVFAFGKRDDILLFNYKFDKTILG